LATDVRPPGTGGAVGLVPRLARSVNDLGRSFYFPPVSFATPGYGDIVLAPGYRIFGALEAACGSLMLGWSTG
jgi:hypothetical protein